MQKKAVLPVEQKVRKAKLGPLKKTIGPVAELERHLPADWWKTLFNSLYLKTDGDVVENNLNTEHEVDLLVQVAGLERDQNLLDICCGQGRHSLELASRGFTQVQGIDRSNYLIRLARKRAEAAGLNVKFSEGDARKLRVPKMSKDAVFIMGNSFGYFEKEEDDLAVLQGIMKILRSEGKLVLDIVNGEWMSKNFEPRSWEWVDQKFFVNRERSLAADGKRIISREIITNSDIGVIADQFYAERLYTKDEIISHLRSIGFVNVEQACEVQANSTRMQDLGMMSNRLIISCQAPVKHSSSQVRVEKKRAVTVLMGDPSLPDKIKRGGVFNEEDLDTIKQLKEGLAQLADFEISYLTEHKSLLRTLIQQPPSFVLNLCDEGYKNDALMELHIPALLEMLGVPYSGAGPGCLSLCYDKHKVGSIALSLDIPVPLETLINLDDISASIPDIFPAIIKPSCGDSSIGITQQAVVYNNEQLFQYLNTLKHELPESSILIQEFLEGTEYTVGIIGNGDDLEVLPILEVDYSLLPDSLPQILSYESKWLPDSPYWNDIRYVEARLSAEQQNNLVNYSAQLFRQLGCRDYARFDFRCDKHGEIKLLEANPNPGWCWDGKMNLMAKLKGYSYSELLGKIVEAALRRYDEKEVS